MKAKLLFLLKYYVYWVALSLFAKGIFMLYEWKDSATLEAGERCCGKACPWTCPWQGIS